ncbi:hypothetical protein VNI00_014336 [Paramarasmius palmivorus]|uniref:Uncharacterized protein n=1 Tax=Paramarasmius palmivorus TaxID=297713 RepID=A0AAW0BTD1_9AGAR
MSSTSYPSPPTSNGSSPHLDAELNAAFQRVRQLRRELIQNYVAETSRAHSSSMGPPHGAILLSGSPDSGSTAELAALERLRSAISVEAMERLRQFETEQVGSDGDRSSHPHRMTTNHLSPLNLDSSQATSSNPLSFTPLSPVSPPRQQFLPRRQLETSHSPLLRELYEDSRTTLGRRVESRTSMDSNSSRRSAETGTVSNPTIVFRFQTRQRRSEPTPPHRPASIPSASQPETPGSASHSLESPSQSLGAPVRGTNRRMRNNVRGSGDSRQSSSSGGRLSVLSNFSVQNLPTPSSTLHHGPSLLFDEPTSYDERERMESIDEEMSGPQPRSYVVNRQMTTSGEEYVHEVNMDWDALGMSERVASSPVQFPADYTLRTTLGRRVFSLQAPPENRSFDVLQPDADENFIPSYRRPMFYRPTRQENHEGSSAHSSQQASSRGSSPVDAADPPRILGSDAPFCPDPLPMPLEQMVQYKNRPGHSSSRHNAFSSI